MAIVGGLRQRLIFDSLKNEIERALTSIGWFNSGRQHLPINFITEPVDDRTEVPLNTIALVPEDIFTSDLELGSLLGENRRTYYIDIYAESLSLGEHLTFDIRDILQGRFPSHGRSGPVVDIFDYTQATPPKITFVEIEFVTVDRAHAYSYAWQKYWWSVRFTVIDNYADEND